MTYLSESSLRITVHRIQIVHFNLSFTQLERVVLQDLISEKIYETSLFENLNHNKECG